MEELWNLKSSLSIEYHRNPEVFYNLIALTDLPELRYETQAGRRIRNWSSLVLIIPEFDPERKDNE